NLFRFVKRMIAFRNDYPVLSRERFYTSDEVVWLSPLGGPPDWFDPYAKQCGCLIREDAEPALLFIFNAGIDSIDFHLPTTASGAQWQLIVDTAHETLQGLSAMGAEHVGGVYPLSMRSSAIFVAR
ncbi:MAG TPA: hypothetical protein VLO13_09120, partial [Halomonas sp.]|nr:hypothetical protein [Halomonas sp.]